MIVFFTTLQQLEYRLGFFGYYRKFVLYYTSIVRPLQILKTLYFKESSFFKNQRRRFVKKTFLLSVLDEVEEKVKKVWETIKELLYIVFVLVYPNFDKLFIFYVDGSKERGFRAVLYQMDDEDIERFVLYFFKDLLFVEMNFWPIEFETGVLVWSLQKLLQYFDYSKFIVWTDYSVIKDTFSLATVYKKRSLRFVNWRLFLSKYIDRIEIKYCTNKTYNNINGLSCIARIDDIPKFIILFIVYYSGAIVLVNFVTVYSTIDRFRRVLLVLSPIL